MAEWLRRQAVNLLNVNSSKVRILLFPNFVVIVNHTLGEIGRHGRLKIYSTY